MQSDEEEHVSRYDDWDTVWKLWSSITDAGQKFSVLHIPFPIFIDTGDKAAET
jgi:hypothetical protein